ncbi:Hsp20 family protein [Chryseobacterium indologenes]|uniref:Hsp20 family protein n=1 Tax=Chryseobacterium indologenes TaxID=253 RepID=UPI0030196684
MDKNDFQIRLDGNLLTISSAKEDRKETKDEKFHKKRIQLPIYQKSFELPKMLWIRIILMQNMKMAF